MQRDQPKKFLTRCKKLMDHLHELGWTDIDILDALTHGTNMIGSSILMKTFKMDQTC